MQPHAETLQAAKETEQERQLGVVFAAGTLGSLAQLLVRAPVERGRTARTWDPSQLPLQDPQMKPLGC